MFTTIAIIAGLALIAFVQHAKQVRNDEFYQQQTEGFARRAREQDVRMNRK